MESEEGESESGDEEKDGQVNGDEEQEEEGNEEEDGRSDSICIFLLAEHLCDLNLTLSIISIFEKRSLHT